MGVAQRRLDSATVARLIWGLAGIAWAAASLQLLGGARYWAAASLVDYLAVWLYTAAWLLAAPTILLLARGSSAHANVLAVIFAAAAIVVGAANAGEDAFGLRWLGTVYVVGVLVAALTLILLTATLWRAGFGRLAGLTAALLVGMACVTVGGGVLVLAALCALAAAPAWFDIRLGDDRLLTSSAD